MTVNSYAIELGFFTLCYFIWNLLSHFRWIISSCFLTWHMYHRRNAGMLTLLRGRIQTKVVRTRRDDVDQVLTNHELGSRSCP